MANTCWGLYRELTMLFKTWLPQDCNAYNEPKRVLTFVEAQIERCKGIAKEHNVLKVKQQTLGPENIEELSCRHNGLVGWQVGKNGPPSSNSICFTNHPSHNTTNTTIPHNTTIPARPRTEILSRQSPPPIQNQGKANASTIATLKDDYRVRNINLCQSLQNGSILRIQ